MPELKDDIQTEVISSPVKKRLSIPEKAFLSLIPVTPVPFKDFPYSIGRVALYGAGAAFLWDKNRKASYALAACAGISLFSSMTATAWGNGE
jgi:hypothetical protein